MNEPNEELEAAVLSDTPPADVVARVDELNELAWSIRRNNTKESFELSRQALDLAEANSYPRGVAYSHRNIGYCHLIMGDHGAALKEEREALSMFKGMGDDNGVAWALFCSGRIYLEGGEFSSAIASLSESLRIFEGIGDRRGIVYAVTNIGNVYYYLGEHTKALDYYQQTLRIAEESGDRNLLVHPLCNISAIYDQIGQHESAVGYMGRALQTSREVRDVMSEALCLTNLGEFHRQAGDIAYALAYQLEALKVSRESLNKYNESGASLNLGKAYHSAGEYEKAFESYASCLRVSREIGNKLTESDCLMGLGEMFCETEEYDRMVESFSQAVNIAREVNLSEYVYKAYLGLSRAHELRGDFAQALARYKDFFECRRKVFNEEADMKLGRLIVQAEFEKAQKEAEIHQLRHVELAARVRELEEALSRARHLQGLLSIDTHVYEFGPFRLEAAERRLSRAGRAVQLTAKVFDLLLLLVQNAGHLVKKEEIMRDLWQAAEVEESNITVSVSVLRRALGEGGYIETVPKSGYRFVAEVRHSD